QQPFRHVAFLPVGHRCAEQDAFRSTPSERRHRDGTIVGAESACFNARIRRRGQAFSLCPNA
ncbi:MAG: hypothetical protein ABWY14_02270, partial [Tardiphaga sp.]